MADPSSKTIRDFFSNSTSALLYYGASDAQAYKYTSIQPHSCAHCQSITFPVSEFAKVAVGERDRVQVGDDSPAPECRVSLLDFTPALAAARVGCALYEWALDSLVLEESRWRPLRCPSRELSLKLIFSITPYNNWRWEFCARLLATITDHDGAVHVVHCKDRLACRVGKDDPLASLVPFRPAEGNTFSQKSVDFAKSCLRTCLGHHGDCVPDMTYGGSLVGERTRQQPGPETALAWLSAPIPPGDLPTRLLKIGGGSTPMVQLVDLSKSSTDTVSSISVAGYAALSYCWGRSGNPLQLLQTTTDTLERGISCTQLPGTLRDVVTLSALIGIKYIWIDALCIYQDSNADKQVELAKMAQYYHNNTVTICAASAASAAEGLMKESTRPVHKHGPIAIPIHHGRDRPNSRLLLHSNSLELSEPTTARGWTMQESLLSRRLLICSDQLYFCCATSNAECAGVFTKLSTEHDRNFSEPKSLVPGIFPAAVWRIYPLMHQWASAVQEFSKRAISFGDDKLPAISGFARVIHAKCRATEDDEDAAAAGISSPTLHRRYPVQYDGVELMYAAGVFLSYVDQAVNSNLLWQANMKGVVRYTGGYRAPSWSWACLDGPIVEFHGSSDVERVVARLTHHEYEPVSGLNPYGAIRYASIHVSAPVRLALDLVEALPVKLGSDHNSFLGLALYPDTEEDLVELKQQLELRSEDLYLMCLESHNGDYEGLIIRRAEDVDGGSAQEVEGLGSFCRRGYFKLEQRQWKRELGHKSCAYFDLEPSIVKLI